jgi:hypothetical protein
VRLLTDGTEKDPVLGFCLTVISQHGESWPLPEDALAQEFVEWFGLRSVLTRDALKKLCQAKGVGLSFVPLPQDIRGFNCSFQNKKEIVIAERELAPFADSHTLLHEFRELLEHEFVELGHATIGAEDSLEVEAEIFAMACRIEAGERDLPVFLEVASKVEKKWVRYLGYAFVGVFGLAYLFGCIYMGQLEEMGSEVHRQRYVRT